MEGLDASYALLNDVNAQNRELQARLRSRVPLLWTNNALVMTAPRRRRHAEQSADSEADQMLLALEGHTSLHVSRRYKRRVEWEVARRIARVDRELQQYPPAQRFWNRRRKESTPPQSSSYKQRANEVQKVGSVRQKQTEKRRRGKTDAQLEKRLGVKPQIRVETGGEQREVKHVATSPLRSAETEDKENVRPNAATRTQVGERIETSGMKKLPVWKEMETTKTVASEPLDDQLVFENNMEVSHSDDPSNGHEVIGDEILNEPGKERPGSPCPVSSSLADTIADVHQESIHDNTFGIEEKSPRIKTSSEEHPSSSIGRQVLSEFRTMPSVASFGAQPLLSAGGLGKMGDMRLNADVLRRLFSDLDTDKDGHVNRIETCMALHRLQISVSTTKIISFFRHIHSSTNGKSVRSRQIQHLPMNEVINYKEFVAFVTAAYDQQQQRKAQRGKAPTRHQVWKGNHDAVQPLPVPSTTLPIYAHPVTTPEATQDVHATVLLREDQVRAYEIDDTNSHQGFEFEEKVIQEIPDLLVSRILADTSNAASVEIKSDALSVVRKSLESLVGKEAVDDEIVKQITQELIRERLRTSGVLNQDMDDVTGLKRAAAYFNEQMMLGDIESYPVPEDSSSNELVNWADVLTEEQVSGLVQQIWKDRQNTIQHAPLEPVEDKHIEDVEELPEDRSVKWRDEATDTSDFAGTQTVSEKAVQAFNVDNQEEFASIPEEAFEENRDDVVVPIPSPPASDVVSMCPLRTNLARELTLSLGGSGERFRELFSPITSIGILQRLRQQRRMNKSMFVRHQAHSCTDDAMQRRSVADRGEDINDIQIDSLDRASILTSEEEGESISSRSMEQLDAPMTEFVPLTEKVLNLDNSTSDQSSLAIARSISTSSSGSSNKHMHSIYQEIDQHQCHARTRSTRSRRLNRHQRRSVTDSNWNAELSEGEVSLEDALDLSDGEIFGEDKKHYIRHKNKVSSVESRCNDDNLHSSVESGELPALMKAHANFRHQLVVQSISSVESGEHEDGSIPD